MCDACVIKIPILASEEELLAMADAVARGEDPNEVAVKGRITDVPDNFKQWVAVNEERIQTAESLPYFLQDLHYDNIGGVDVLQQQVRIEHANARSSGTILQNIAEHIASQYNIVVPPINNKTADSTIRKIRKARKEGENIAPHDLKDLYRNTIVAENPIIESIISELKSVDDYMRHKQQNTPLGYSGNIVNIRIGNIVGEIQVNTPEMIYAKHTPDKAKIILGEKIWNTIRKKYGIEGGLGHKYYEAWRVLPEDSTEAMAIVKQSIAYYSSFRLK